MKIKLIGQKDLTLTQSLLAGGYFHLTDSDQDLDHVIVSGGSEIEWHEIVARYGAARTTLLTNDPRPNPPTRSAWSPMPCPGWHTQRLTVSFPLRPQWSSYKTKEIVLPIRLTRETRLNQYQASLAAWSETFEPYEALEAVGRGCLPLSPQWNQSLWPDWPAHELAQATDAFLSGCGIRQVWGDYIPRVYWTLENSASSRAWYSRWFHTVT